MAKPVPQCHANGETKLSHDWIEISSWCIYGGGEAWEQRCERCGLHEIIEPGKGSEWWYDE